MGGFSLLHVPAGTGPTGTGAGLAAVRDALSGRRQGLDGWVQENGDVCLEAGPDEIPELAVHLSRKLGVAVTGVFAESVADCFGFWRYKNGRRRRVLRYGLDGPEDRVWNEASGRPEPWEPTLLFRSGPDLEELLGWVDEAEREDVRRAHLERRIAVGGHEPGIDASSLGSAVLRHYGISPEGERVAVVRVGVWRTLREAAETVHEVAGYLRDSIRVESAAHPDEVVSFQTFAALLLLLAPLVVAAFWTPSSQAWHLTAWLLATLLATRAAHNARRHRDKLEATERGCAWTILAATVLAWVVWSLVASAGSPG